MTSLNGVIALSSGYSTQPRRAMNVTSGQDAAVHPGPGPVHGHGHPADQDRPDDEEEQGVQQPVLVLAGVEDLGQEEDEAADQAHDEDRAEGRDDRHRRRPRSGPARRLRGHLECATVDSHRRSRGGAGGNVPARRPCSTAPVPAAWKSPHEANARRGRSPAGRSPPWPSCTRTPTAPSTTGSPIQLLVATILSAQCTDARVNLVTPALFARYKTVRDFAGAEPRELERLIASTGFFRNKAKNIIACCRAILDRHNGEVPGTLEELVRTPRRRPEDGERDPGQRVRRAGDHGGHPRRPAEPAARADRP